METPETAQSEELPSEPERFPRWLRAFPWKPVLLTVLLGLAMLGFGLVCSPAYWR